MLEWNEEFGIKNQHLDEQHKKFLQRILEAYELSQSKSEAKKSALVSLIGVVTEELKEHFKDEETYMKHTSYPFLESHATLHKEMLVNISKLSTNIDDVDVAGTEFYEFLKSWFITHVLGEDKQIESYRNRLRDVKEIPYSLETQTSILAESHDIENEPKYLYICLCHLKEFEVCEALHKLMQTESTFIRCKTCKQPLIHRDDSLDDEDNFETLAKKYFKQF
ncbi:MULTISPECIES: bacteriohemerythrin [Helicobacter]|uniref:Hemerythrin family protein n=1 Tax=Helicobacter ibis TaxID=2962633 RepID=A0ABT4VF11_9HELI|nr:MULTISPECIES: hemerythrin family protein [Helicobacter]MDA3967175.1 hemerythrin family protein [Helicobacter sp. WB40]MDA3969302.1 hemerythrin family protein [Helicobacter ibis]